MVNIPVQKLNTGAEIPVVGLGTLSAYDQEIYDAVSAALKAGYRHIDTAFIYKNEGAVGQAIRESGIPREDIFVTTKAWVTHFYDPHTALQASLDRLGLDYVDLYLVHWPITRVPDPSSEFSGGLSNDLDFDDIKVWSKFQELPKDKARAVGVSNYSRARLEKLLAAPSTKLAPAVNQVELHLQLPQQELVEYCKSKGIVIQAFSPLAQGNLDPVVVEIAKKHNADPGQVALSWNVSRGVVVLPKSVNPGRLASNISLLELDIEDLQRLAELGKTPRRIFKSSEEFGVDVFEDEST